MRRAETVQNPRRGRTVSNDDLKIECWCRQETRDVPREVVRAGETVSCGRRGCEAPS